MAEEHPRWMLKKLFSLVQGTKRSPGELGPAYRDALVKLMALDVNKNTHNFEIIAHIYFPRYAREFWDTFIVHGRGLIEKNEFLTKVLSAIKTHLHRHLSLTAMHRRVNRPDMVKVHRTKFGQHVLTAVKSLSCESFPSCHHGSADVFTNAVSRGMLSEAVLLYDTGSVCPRELAALAQDQDIKKMLTGDDSSGMAAFLRQVLTQSPSLESRCRTQLARRLGDDLQGKLDRARSLGLPPTQCELLVNLHQTKLFMRSVNEEYADSVKKEETETANKKERDSLDTASDSGTQELIQLIDF